MKWIEIIELRSTKEKGTLLKEDLREFVKGLKYEEGLFEAKVLSHGSLESDLSLHLYYDSENVDVSGSPLGLRLLTELKKFGMVDHNIWIQRREIQ
jgi:hypothetical protein